MCSYFELLNCTKEDNMLTKMSKEELIKYITELQNEIENLHAELRMVYNDLGKLLSITKEEI